MITALVPFKVQRSIRRSSSGAISAGVMFNYQGIRCPHAFATNPCITIQAVVIKNPFLKIIQSKTGARRIKRGRAIRTISLSSPNICPGSSNVVGK